MSLFRRAGALIARFFESAADPAAAAGELQLYSKNIAGQPTISSIGADSIPTPMQPSVAHKKVDLQGFSTNLFGEGVVLTSGASPTARTQTSASFCAAQIRSGYASPASAGSTQTYRTNTATSWRGNGPGLGGFTHVFRFNISDTVLVATANMFVGLIASTINTYVAPSTRVNFIGIGCDSGDTVLQLYAAGAVAQPRISLGASFPVNTTSVDVYELTLYAQPNGLDIGYKVERLNTGDVTSGTISAAAQLPSSTTLLTPQLFRSNGGTAAAVAFDLAYVYRESR